MNSQLYFTRLGSCLREICLREINCATSCATLLYLFDPRKSSILIGVPNLAYWLHSTNKSPRLMLGNDVELIDFIEVSFLLRLVYVCKRSSLH